MWRRVAKQYDPQEDRWSLGEVVEDNDDLLGRRTEAECCTMCRVEFERLMQSECFGGSTL